MQRVLVGVVSAADFQRARRHIPDLAGHGGYDDWLDSRYGRFMGLSIGGAEASLETVALDGFLDWCATRGMRPSETALDAYARFCEARSGREPLSAA